ncbi:MAG: alkaline phosphatase PhoX, partial [Methylophilus sp.]
MNKRSIPLIVASLFAATLTACGGGDSGTTPSTAKLSDAYVKGISYSNVPGNLIGTTGVNGEFKYLPGDKVTFKMGNVVLGTVDMSSSALGVDGGLLVVRPKDIAGVTSEDDEKSISIAQFIQSAAGTFAVNARNIDVSGSLAKLTGAGVVDSLEKVKTLLAAAGITPKSLDEVTAHLMSAPTNVKSVEFTSTDVAGLSDANRAIAYTNSSAIVTYADGSKKTFPLAYNTLFNNTDTDKTADGSAAATIRDKNGKPILDAGNKPFVPQTPDANSLLSVGGTPYMVTHFEYVNNDSTGTNQYGKVPMTMTVSKLSQSKTDGKLAVSSIKQVDFSKVNGLWIPCAGSRSPWNTHLGSEEYEPDARCDVPNGDTVYAASSACSSLEYEARMNAFRKLYGDTAASPYNYGRVPEVTVNIDGSSSVEKWYTLGRLSREKVSFFADSRTAIQGDDGTYTMLTMFVADKAKDLSAGTLYAAKWTPTDNAKGGAGSVSWIKLGHTTNAAIKGAVDAGVKFSDLFETSTVAAAGFTQVTHGHETKVTEYLKLKTGTFAGVDIATLAAFLETRRYGALNGATVELEKFEGVAYNAKDGKAYMAIASIGGGMSDKLGDVQLKGVKAGAVYELNLKAGQKDSLNNAIDSAFVPVDMSGLVIGTDIATDAEGNKSAVDGISRPDNLSYSERMRVLFIGEDSGYHLNNYLWAFHVDTGKLVRILSLPIGAESTGL